jgi:cystathionine beta-lyase/cystathionine gamma-synthase
LGADISYNSCTKYLAGHSDLVMGAVILNNEDLYKKLFHVSFSLGANPSPFDCFLLHRGIKTLELRVIKSTGNAYHLANWMEKNENV